MNVEHLDNVGGWIIYRKCNLCSLSGTSYIYEETDYPYPVCKECGALLKRGFTSWQVKQLINCIEEE